jgi:hypothetical protein
MVHLAFPSSKFSYFPADNVLYYLLNFYVHLLYLFSIFKFIRFPANYVLLFFSIFRFIWPDAKDVRSSLFHFQVLSLLCSTYRFIWFPSDYVLSSFLHFHFYLVSFKDVLFSTSQCGLRPYNLILFGLKHSPMNSSFNQRPLL